ncbi:TatD-related deoxyribonuclease [Halarchaeum rubridurum]|uniref:Deoxyribonuclease n=1 Tax=Halarchaeum rubridurum TaxID=489911 RepID=A0A830FSH6_9EURY|nr:TatD family hydrolase [Halarchaeum rubridurum]MBP1953805.1 TatD-related deoxyribonuclease [Halarchaeum rubridurum]GGM54838.1 deoxyribonuclease [Halarchaeum rubridurum]
MRDLGTPVLDDHLHLDREGARGIDAVREFARAGGTHLLVVNKPSWHLGVEAETGADFRAVFEETERIVADASEELRGRAWPVLGVHPGLISRLVDERGFGPDEAADLMCAGLDAAAEYAAEGDAVALKSGRPHYEVSDAVWDASNRVLRHALERAAETGVALQLHTEATEDLTDVAAWAEDAGQPPERVVKHYASGTLAGVTKSVMCEKDYLDEAVDSGEPFLMETDYVDDTDRPGAVMGPKTVPRRVAWLQERGDDEAVRRAHVETPEAVYGIDTEATLD